MVLDARPTWFVGKACVLVEFGGARETEHHSLLSAMGTCATVVILLVVGQVSCAWLARNEGKGSVQIIIRDVI